MVQAVVVEDKAGNRRVVEIEDNGANTGMPLRDWYAGLALQSLISRIPWGTPYSDVSLALAANQLADAMLKARKE